MISHAVRRTVVWIAGLTAVLAYALPFASLAGTTRTGFDSGFWPFAVLAIGASAWFGRTMADSDESRRRSGARAAGVAGAVAQLVTLTAMAQLSGEVGASVSRDPPQGFQTGVGFLVAALAIAVVATTSFVAAIFGDGDDGGPRSFARP